MDQGTLRELQKIEIEEVKDIARFCEENGIGYFLDSGTLLGAVRHQGFIPWDDDTDIAMDVHSYYRFLGLTRRGALDRMFPGKYYVQNYRNDETMRAVWTKVRRNGTTVTRADMPVTDSHAGACLDVFVMAGLTRTRAGRRIQRRASRILKAMMSREEYLLGGGTLTRGERFVWEHWPRVIRRGFARVAERVLLLPTGHSEVCFSTFYTPLEKEFVGLPSDSYIDRGGEPAKRKTYEGALLRVPENPETILERYYGDWKTPPKEEERTGHGDLIVDLSHDYHWYRLPPEAVQVIAEVFHLKGNRRNGSSRKEPFVQENYREIRKVRVLKNGMTNRSFYFEEGGGAYILRVPGAGTEQLIDREQETEVYRAIQGKGLCDEPVFLDGKRGFKITRYLNGARPCDPFCEEDVRRCMKELKTFHRMKLRVGHSFHLFGQIAFYQKLWNGAISAYEDHEEVTRQVLSLKRYIDTVPKDWCLSHIDAVADNFLFYGGRDEEKGQPERERLQLTDWEYAGMQDPHLDIAMFCLYSSYDKAQVNRVIDFYFEGDCPERTRTKIYCYMAAGGLLWSNWCEYKSQNGVTFGEYSRRQYQCAKEYYRYAEERIRGEQYQSGGSGRSGRPERPTESERLRGSEDNKTISGG